MQVSIIEKLIKVCLMLCLIEFAFYHEMVHCKKKETKNKCGVKLVAIERIKYKLVPVEVPKHNYLADKQLSNQELKNAWKVFEYSGIKQNLQGGTSQIDDDEQSNRDTGLMSNHHSPSNLPVPMPVHSNMQSPQMSPQMPPISVSVNGVPVNPVLMHQNHQPSSNMQPQVIYQRYDTADLDLENIKESVRDSSKDSLHSYKDHNRDYSSKHSLPKLKRRSSLKRKISKKVFYDYD